MAVSRQLTHSADAWKLLHGVVSVICNDFLLAETGFKGVPVQATWSGAVEDAGLEQSKYDGKSEQVHV